MSQSPHKTATAERYRIGFDIGGTFTDFVLVDRESASIRLYKCLTTPEDPAIGALDGINALIAEAGLELAEIGHLVHGTTLVTNAIIERRGCKLGFITTAGFLDILEMGTEQRYDIHDLFLRFPEPLATRQYRRQVPERIDRDGEVVTPIDLQAVRQAAGELTGAGIEAIAICFLHAYKNPAHERAARDLIEAEFPDLPVSISSEVQPQLREYERSSTTAANAYVLPLMSAYVKNLVDAFRGQGFTGRFHLLQSSGGLTGPETAAALPVRFLESGPAGSARATAFIGQGLGLDDIISFDMGGTTAKACLIQDGRPDVAPMLEAGRVHRFKRGSGLPIHAPVIDMIEIGAGGGSIARTDALGLLKVGPQSAGAVPGPACYGQGGSAPTVTDANLLLGYLDPGYFLGGRMSLDIEQAEKAMAGLAGDLGMTALEAAWGIYDLVCENMAGAARVHIVEKGHDPRGYAMVAMGGAGPLHAARVAAKLGVRQLLVPPASGAASALGLLVAPISFEVARSLPMSMSAADLPAANALLAELEVECRGRLVAAGVEAADPAITVKRSADMRLAGQMHEITIALPEHDLDTKELADLATRFAEEYARLYTHVYDGADIETLNWRVVCAGPTPTLTTELDGAGRGGAMQKGLRKAYFPDAGGLIEVPVYDRYALVPESRLVGPAIIEEREATTVVPPGADVAIDSAHNLVLELPAAAAREIVVASDDPLEGAVKRIESDPIGLEIMWSRLINITEECWQTVIRTAFSLIIGEAQDFACEILDAKGRQIAHSPRAMPVFNLTLPMAVKAMIERYPPQLLHPGDVLITNDPWLCAGHLFDIAIAVPVFHHDALVSFVGVVGHVADIGGTKDSLNAREIFEEGLQIPPMKIYRAGEANQDLLELMRENVRQPEQVLGDVHALISAGLTGAERISQFMDEYGMHDLEALAEVVQGRAEAAMRAAISELPDGIYESVVEADGIDSIMRYPARVTVAGDCIEVDFEGAPPQTERGGSNCTLSYTMAHATYPLKCILTPEVPGNAGCYRPMTVRAPKGSILNCDKPMAVNTRTRTGWYIAPNLFQALAAAAPGKVQAFTGLPSSALFYGLDQDDKTYSDHLFQGGGQGASASGDGLSALLYPTSAANTSIEMFETRVPALVESKEFIADSGGAGRYRGGLGQVIRARKLADDGRDCQAGLYPNGVMTAVRGLFQGRPGSLAKATAMTASGEHRDLGVGGLATLTNSRQWVDMRLAGGAGYGDPLERDLADVQRDLDRGYISRAGAEQDYGCITGDDGRIDQRQSDALRAELSTRTAAE